RRSWWQPTVGRIGKVEGDVGLSFDGGSVHAGSRNRVAGERHAELASPGGSEERARHVEARDAGAIGHRPPDRAAELVRQGEGQRGGRTGDPVIFRRRRDVDGGYFLVEAEYGSVGVESEA